MFPAILLPLTHLPPATHLLLICICGASADHFTEPKKQIKELGILQLKNSLDKRLIVLCMYNKRS